MNTQFRLMPEQASSIAADVDALYAFLLIVSAVLTVGIAGAILYLAIKYRRKAVVDRTPVHSHFLAIELSWIIGPFLLTMFMFVWGAKLYFYQSRPPVDAMVINCVGRQWMWKFQHPDGRAEINDLHVPLNQSVRVNMISDDVIHSLYLPAFRVKQDVLPGRYTSIWFKPTKVGIYHLFCAEYCGAKHSGMRGAVHVMEPSRYQQWLEDRADGVPAAGSVRLFDQLRCFACHLGGGEVSRGPSLQNLYGRTVSLDGGQTVVADENYIRESILRPGAKIVAGFESIMPSFEGQVTEEGILQLIGEIKAMGQSDARGSGTSDSLNIKPIGPDQTPTRKPARNNEDPGAPKPPDPEPRKSRTDVDSKDKNDKASKDGSGSR